MKLRIHRNSIRLRLSQTDIAEFERTGLCSEELLFTNSSLKYILKQAAEEDQLKEPTVDLQVNAVIVTVPFVMGRKWVNSDEVGFHNKAHEHEDSQEISILVEKDFQCLHKRPMEDESDSFPNPLAE